MLIKSRLTLAMLIDKAATMISDLHVVQLQACWNSDAQLYWKGWCALIVAHPQTKPFDMLLLYYAISDPNALR